LLAEPKLASVRGKSGVGGSEILPPDGQALGRSHQPNKSAVSANSIANNHTVIIDSVGHLESGWLWKIVPSNTDNGTNDDTVVLTTALSGGTAYFGLLTVSDDSANANGTITDILP
jgi:hypothetical protein